MQTCVTSPPYYGLRDYGQAGQIGLEQTPDAYIARLVEVFREVRRCLRDDGTLWLNLGDSYASGGSGGSSPKSTLQGYTGSHVKQAVMNCRPLVRQGAAKQLLGIPWRVAFALQSDGWYLRQDIIWCLSGGAWVYARTQKGDMPVMVKDLVRLDPATVRLWNGAKWTRVLGWGPSNDESERLEIVLRSGERIGCTGGHQWPTQRGSVVARELQVGDTIQTCRLPQPDGCERPAYLTDDALWLVGLYLAEGSRNGNAYQLSLAADEQHWLPRIEAVARHYGGSCTHTVSGGSLTVRLFGAVLHALIDAYIGGKVAVDKHLKVAAWRLPDDALRLIVCGYLDGDGHDDEHNGRWRLGFCRNYALERDLRTAAARLGATLTLKPVAASCQGGELPAFRGEWRWERSGHHNEKDRGEIVEIRASRARGFWDIAVEDEPHLFALASGVLTHNCKPNPMPESVRDRCTKAHEYLFLLSKSPRYYFDAAAIAEPAAGVGGGACFGKQGHDASGTGAQQRSYERPTYQTRNRRSVWTITPRPFKGAHFATFPPALVEPCILAATSAHGHCAACGAGWVRVEERERKADPHRHTGRAATGCNDRRDASPPCGKLTTCEVRWRPACRCTTSELRPGVVLDPFTGAGTTGLVAVQHGRAFVGIELNPEYLEMARQRIEAATNPET